MGAVGAVEMKCLDYETLRAEGARKFLVLFVPKIQNVERNTLALSLVV